jgi:protein-disulfide isomerase
MEKRFWIIIGVIAVIFVGILYFGGKDKNATSGTTSAQPTNHVKGKLDSKVTLVEYGDFECPVCGVYYPTVTQVLDKYQDKIKFQFRNLPLSQVHQHAFAAARVAEAASEQGKFWEMYQALFSNRDTWTQASDPTPYFKQYAAQIGLDSKKFEADVASSKTNDVVNADVAAFKKTGDPMATPTFYLNGKKIDLKTVIDQTGQPSAEKFSGLIDAVLKSTDQQ